MEAGMVRHAHAKEIAVDAPDDMTRLRAYIDSAAERGEMQLPPEPRLSEALDVSRGRLRTLLKRVEDEGLIWRHVGKGTFIGQRASNPAAPGWSADISLADVMQARQMLEPKLAAQAALAARAADIAAMEKCLVDMDRSHSYAQWKLLDERLHRLIAEATHNPLILVLYDTLRSSGRQGLDNRLAQVFGHQIAPHATTDQHRDLVAAIANHDPVAAENQMIQHLAFVRDCLFGLR